MAHALAMISPHITAEVVEAQEFPELAQRYAVRGVPKTVINDKVKLLGAVPEEAFANAVFQALDLPPHEFNAPSET